METLNPFSFFHIHDDTGFEQSALSVFRFQYDNNPVYQAYCQHLNIQKEQVNSLADIPFLPISFFKTHEVKTTYFSPELTFRSSGTTGMTQSQHHIKDENLYRQSLIQGFRHFYGDPSDYTFLALLPNYLE